MSGLTQRDANKNRGGPQLLAGLGLANTGRKGLQVLGRADGAIKDTWGRLGTLGNLGADMPGNLAQQHYLDAGDTFENVARHLSKVPKVLRNRMKLMDPQAFRAAAATGALEALDPELYRRVASTPGLLDDVRLGRNLRDASGKALDKTWKELDVVNTLRTLGFKDYEKADQIRKQVPAFSGYVRNIQTSLEPQRLAYLKATRHLRNVGRVGALAGAGLALKSGVDILGRRPSREFPKFASVLRGEFDRQDAALPGAYLMGSGVRRHARDLNNIMVTFGENDALGQGHAQPGRNIAEAIRRRANGKFNVVEAPLGQSAFLSSNPQALKKYYAAGLDTGWGLLDPNYNPDWAYSGRPTGFSTSRARDKMRIGEGWMRGRTVTGHEADRRVLSKIKFHPDPPTGTGMPIGHLTDITHGARNRGVPGWLSGLLGDRGDYSHATFGGLDPRNPRASKHMFTSGAMHPGVKVGDAVRLARPDYLKELAITSGLTDEKAINDFVAKNLGKKVLTVTGASRGDSVGVRVRMLHDTLKRAGKLDDYLIVGMGGKGVGAQRRIAEAGTAGLGNTLWAGFTNKFRDLANSSDAHFMGMGGMTPPEMLSHGGAPILTVANEQVGRLKVPKNYKGTLEQFVREQGLNDGIGVSWGKLDRSAGLQGQERALLIRHLRSPAGKAESPEIRKQLMEMLRKPGHRGWMNPVEAIDPRTGKTMSIARGLDLAREQLDNLGVRQLRVADARAGSVGDDLLKAIEDATGGRYNQMTDKGLRWDDVAQSTRKGLQESQDSMADFVIRKARMAKRLHHLRTGLLRTAPGAAMLGFAAAPSLAQWRRSTANRNKGYAGMFKRSSADSLDWKDIARVGLGAGVVSGGLDTYAKADRLASVFRAAEATGGVDQHDIRSMLSRLDDYGRASKDLLNSRMLGVRNSTILKVAPPSMLDMLGNPLRLWAGTFRPRNPVTGKSLLPRVSGVSFGDRRKLLNKWKHYQGFATDPTRTVLNEIATGRSYGGPVRAMGDAALESAYARAAKAGEGTLMQRMAPVLDLYDKAGDARKSQIRYPVHGLYNFLMGPKNMWTAGPLVYSRIAKGLALPAIAAGGYQALKGGRGLLADRRPAPGDIRSFWAHR